MSNNDKIAELKQTIREGVRELEGYANIEMAVGSQLDRSKEDIKKLNRKLRENREKIELLDAQLQNEEEIAKDELPGEGVQPEPPTYDAEKKEIAELEEQIRALNRQKAELAQKLK